MVIALKLRFHSVVHFRFLLFLPPYLEKYQACTSGERCEFYLFRHPTWDGNNQKQEEIGRSVEARGLFVSKFRKKENKQTSINS